MKDSKRAKDVYITQDLRKSDTAGKESINQSDLPSKGARLSAKGIDRKVIINNVIYKVSNIPEDLRPPQSSAQA